MSDFISQHEAWIIIVFKYCCVALFNCIRTDQTAVLTTNQQSAVLHLSLRHNYSAAQSFSLIDCREDKDECRLPLFIFIGFINALGYGFAFYFTIADMQTAWSWITPMHLIYQIHSLYLLLSSLGSRDSSCRSKPWPAPSSPLCSASSPAPARPVASAWAWSFTAAASGSSRCVCSCSSHLFWAVTHFVVRFVRNVKVVKTKKVQCFSTFCS